MYRKILLQGLLSGFLAGLAGVIYNRIHYYVSQADFSRIITPVRLFGWAFMVTLVAGFVFWILTSWLKKKGEILFNFLFSLVSFTLVLVPISYTLPLDVSFPELFPGLTVPMVFFPAIAWYTVRPLFKYPGLG